MNAPILPRAALFVALIFCAATARAQNYRSWHTVSLEARIAQSPTVVHGAIAEVTGAPTYPERPDGPYTYTVVVKVGEVLKGAIRDKTLKFTRRGSRQWPQLEEWGRTHADFLWFLDETGRMGDKDLGSDERYIPLPPPENSTRVYSMDLTRLTTAAEILARAHAFAAQKSGATQTEELLLPVETEGMVLGGNNLGAKLTVPVGPPLEKIAHRLIADPGSFVKNPDAYAAVELRADGASALRWFKSAENIKLLKPLLADPGRYTTADSNGNYAYPARQAAYETLKAWGVKVPEPVMWEKLPADAK